jgi:hypothetical protein
MNDMTREELNFLSAALNSYKFWESTSREHAPSGKSFFDIQDEIKGKIANAVASLTAAEEAKATEAAEEEDDMDVFDPLPKFSAKSSDGGYGADAKHQLWRIAGKKYPGLGYVVGNIMDFENIDLAADAADEEARVLMHQAREEFGYE